MKHKKSQVKHENKPIDLAALKVPCNVFFGIVVSLGILISGLLYSACLGVSAMNIALVAIPDQQTILERKINRVVDGYPIEVMAPYIAEQNKTTAAFLVGIAKKESNWGKRVPVDTNGDDCFNYWGYKGAGSRGIEMGHGCFGSKEEAVSAVGDRLQELVALRETSEPKNMTIWKCGSSCKGHSDESVDKWISDVSIYYDRIAIW